MVKECSLNRVLEDMIYTCSQFKVPDWGDKVDTGIELSHPIPAVVI